MATNQPNSFDNISANDSSPEYSPSILLSGDNARTASMLHQALLDEGFQVQLAAPYRELEPAWQMQHPPIVLLEVSGAHSVEAAVHAALQLKRRDPLQFVGYLADPALHASGLAGDGIFPRTSGQLAKALRRRFRDDD
jgi:PleD family two-component response regulator